MTPAARKIRDTYSITPGAPLLKREFGYYCLERWAEEGLAPDADFAAEFDYDTDYVHYLGELGWCEAAFVPPFEERTIEDRGAHEVIQDASGRRLLVFKGRRSGFMPEYLEHPVTDRASWESKCKWRMDPSTPERLNGLEDRMREAVGAVERGLFMSQRVVGGYMYLRSLIGPEDLLYMFYDQPELIHECMKTWLDLADAVTARHQEYVTFDELFLAEDICYNGGCLISPDMMKEFLLPYYQQLVANVRRRQVDHNRHLHLHIDTDGFADPVIPLYRDWIGMDVMSPFEVAAGCDVVEIGKRYPRLVISGGIDKRVIARGPAAIDEHLERIVPPMRSRGGYIPTFDHGVPAEVSLENYRYYRKRMVELGG